ncbi:flagellar biosynthesis anti-sigma factor FlgM [Modicisalibacter radicis]|uniref:flagellar biosynthesis anti-sigma factor FlgM n=1 Tax=Halomonas sp. EAR18 TaxID=2518972 RepID=UPI00109D2FD5|nr:flagellar biosynthesis anti-sigma factor FlgM [Halomonas sp. EAR18]
MKIDNTHPLQRPTQTDSKAAQPVKPDAESQASNPASVAHLSNKTQDTTQDIDTARVAEIRQAISEGRLEIDSGRIADGLIDSVRDLLGKSET